MSDLLFIAASPYQDDVLNLPVKDLDIAIPFYEARLLLLVWLFIQY